MLVNRQYDGLSAEAWRLLVRLQQLLGKPLFLLRFTQQPTARERALLEELVQAGLLQVDWDKQLLRLRRPCKPRARLTYEDAEFCAQHLKRLPRSPLVEAELNSLFAHLHRKQPMLLPVLSKRMEARQ
jgi:hypothetical protein